MKNGKLALGLSPCPNDTFIFHALLNGYVKPDFPEQVEIEPFFADVEKLNTLALAKEAEITKISVGVTPYIAEDYALFLTGAALGWGCGPLVISKEPLTETQMRTASIAIPGKYTTAGLLLTLHGGFQGERKEMLFSDIIPAVARGEVEAGVIIHEGRFTYQNYNLHKYLDLGQWWEDKFHLPLPLGAIAVRRDLPKNLALAMQKAIGESLGFARKNPQASREFIRAHAQELDDNITKAHIDAFVTDFSLNLGETGKVAIETLVNAAMPRKEKLGLFLE